MGDGRHVGWALSNEAAVDSKSRSFSEKKKSRIRKAKVNVKIIAVM